MVIKPFLNEQAAMNQMIYWIHASTPIFYPSLQLHGLNTNDKLSSKKIYTSQSKKYLQLVNHFLNFVFALHLQNSLSSFMRILNRYMQIINLKNSKMPKLSAAHELTDSFFHNSFNLKSISMNKSSSECLCTKLRTIVVRKKTNWAQIKAFPYNL